MMLCYGFEFSGKSLGSHRNSGIHQEVAFAGGAVTITTSNGCDQTVRAEQLQFARHLTAAATALLDGFGRRREKRIGDPACPTTASAAGSPDGGSSTNSF